jgi:hypothetical protein
MDIGRLVMLKPAPEMAMAMAVEVLSTELIDHLDLFWQGSTALMFLSPNSIPSQLSVALNIFLIMKRLRSRRFG